MSLPRDLGPREAFLALYLSEVFLVRQVAMLSMGWPAQCVSASARRLFQDLSTFELESAVDLVSLEDNPRWVEIMTDVTDVLPSRHAAEEPYRAVWKKGMQTGPAIPEFLDMLSDGADDDWSVIDEISIDGDYRQAVECALSGTERELASLNEAIACPADVDDLLRGEMLDSVGAAARAGYGDVSSVDLLVSVLLIEGSGVERRSAWRVAVGICATRARCVGPDEFEVPRVLNDLYDYVLLAR